MSGTLQLVAQLDDQRRDGVQQCSCPTRCIETGSSNVLGTLRLSEALHWSSLIISCWTSYKYHEHHFYFADIYILDQLWALGKGHEVDPGQ